jgi:hypothetical protein
MPVLLCQHGFWQPNYDPPEEHPSMPYADLCIPTEAPRQALIEAPRGVSPTTQTGAPIEPPLPALRAATSVAPVGVSTIFYPRRPIDASGLALPIEAPRLAPRATNPGPDIPNVPVPLPALQSAKAEIPSSGPIRVHSGPPYEASQVSLPIEALRLAALATTQGPTDRRS